MVEKLGCGLSMWISVEYAAGQPLKTKLWEPRRVAVNVKPTLATVPSMWKRGAFSSCPLG